MYLNKKVNLCLWVDKKILRAFLIINYYGGTLLFSELQIQRPQSEKLNEIVQLPFSLDANELPGCLCCEISTNRKATDPAA